MRNKDTILLEQAYQKVLLKETVRGEEPNAHERAGMGPDFDEHERLERWTEPDIDPHVELGEKILERLEYLGAFKYDRDGKDIWGKEYWEYYSDPIINQYIDEYRPYYIVKHVYNPDRIERKELTDNYDIFEHAIGSAWEYKNRIAQSRKDYSEEE
jgi:hypothetical protein